MANCSLQLVMVITIFAIFIRFEEIRSQEKKLSDERVSYLEKNFSIKLFSNLERKLSNRIVSRLNKNLSNGIVSILDDRLAYKPLPIYRKMRKSIPDTNFTKVLLFHKSKINSMMYYHLDFIQTINVQEYNKNSQIFDLKKYYYNLNINIFNLNCNPVMYEIVLLDSDGNWIIYDAGAEKYVIDEMNGIEHEIDAEYLRNNRIKHLFIRYSKKNGGKNSEEQIPIEKPLKVQTEYTLELKNTSQIIPPIIKNLPEIIKFECP